MAKQKENQKIIDPKIEFFKFDLKVDKQLKAFEDIYKKNKGNWSAIKSDLTKKEGFTPAVINNLEFTHHLAEWSKDNVAAGASVANGVGAAHPAALFRRENNV